MKSSKLLNLVLLIIPFFIIFFLFLEGLNSPLSRWDEITNAQIVNENLDGNILELTLNGDHFLEKPPLWYIMTTIVVKILGFTPLSLKLVSIISSFSLILFLSIFIYKKKEFRGLLIFLWTISTSQILFVKSDSLFSTHTLFTADLDALFLLLLFISQILFIYGERRRNLLLASFVAGLAFLTKGPLAVVPILSFIIIKLSKKDNDRRIILEILLVFLITILPWNIYMLLINGMSFINEFYFYHIWGRAVNSIERHSYNPLFYFLIFFNPVNFSTGIGSIFILINLLNRKFIENQFVISLVIFISILLITQTQLAWYIFPTLIYFSILNSFMFDINVVLRKRLTVLICGEFILSIILILLL